MNIYTVRRATQGLADYINAGGLPKAVAIANDSRVKGELFIREAAGKGPSRHRENRLL